MSLYVLDTDIVSLIMKGRLPGAARARLDVLPSSRVAITSVTLGELYYGALRSLAPQKWMDATRRVVGHLDCLGFDAEAALRYGEMRAGLDGRGLSLADADLRIASICLARDLTLISGNEKHFARVPGLRYENWLKLGQRSSRRR